MFAESDVFSLGMMFVELTVGALPTACEPGGPQHISSALKEDSDTWALVEKMLDMDSNKRATASACLGQITRMTAHHKGLNVLEAEVETKAMLWYRFKQPSSDRLERAESGTSFEDAQEEEDPAEELEGNEEIEVMEGNDLFIAVEDRSVNIISVLGNVRTGKSYLMNALTRTSDAFSVDLGAHSHTKGVHVHPHFQTHSEFAGLAPTAAVDGPLVAFVDMEGQGDQPQRYDVKLATPLLLVSKVVLLNVLCPGGPARDEILHSLEMLIDVAAQVAKKQSRASSSPSSLFGHLHVILRDCPHPEVECHAVVFGTESTRRTKGEVKRGIQARNAIRVEVNQAFESRSVWCLPRLPGRAPPPPNYFLGDTLYREKIDEMRKLVAAQVSRPRHFGGELTRDQNDNIISEGVVDKRETGRAGIVLTGESIADLLPNIARELGYNHPQVDPPSLAGSMHKREALKWLADAIKQAEGNFEEERKAMPLPVRRVQFIADRAMGSIVEEFDKTAQEMAPKLLKPYRIKLIETLDERKRSLEKDNLDRLRQFEASIRSRLDAEAQLCFGALRARLPCRPNVLDRRIASVQSALNEVTKHARTYLAGLSRLTTPSSSEAAVASQAQGPIATAVQPGLPNTPMAPAAQLTPDRQGPISHYPTVPAMPVVSVLGIVASGPDLEAYTQELMRVHSAKLRQDNDAALERVLCDLVERPSEKAEKEAEQLAKGFPMNDTVLQECFVRLEERLVGELRVEIARMTVSAQQATDISQKLRLRVASIREKSERNNVQALEAFYVKFQNDFTDSALQQLDATFAEKSENPECFNPHKFVEHKRAVDLKVDEQFEFNLSLADFSQGKKQNARKQLKAKMESHIERLKQINNEKIEKSAVGIKQTFDELCQEDFRKIQRKGEDLPKSRIEFESPKEQLHALLEQKEKEKLIKLEEGRIALFRKTMIGAGGLVPFSLGAGELKDWLMNSIGESKALHDLVALMGAIDGMTILSSWTEVGPGPKGPNFGKISRDRAALSLGLDADEIKKKIKSAACIKLSFALNGDSGETEFNARLAYYKAILMSCEKRSVLTDFDLVRVIGEGGFARCGPCELNHAHEGCGLTLHPSPVALFAHQFTTTSGRYTD